ncbi:MAG: hypothetical protein CMC57_06820 [Flavobacteriaceae bacterium]|nr:hypothetical protein [Flavobacteriaceae bacterium]
MKFIKLSSIFTVSITIINVWLFRFNKPSIYRGGDATNMIEEFNAYGLSESLVYIVGTIKVLFALGLIFGLFWDKLLVFSALVISFLMTAAVFMHLKIGDEFIKSLPATIMFILCLFIIISNYYKKEASIV